MRVIQVIDTLDTGGAERMAINYANSLADYTEASFLCCTRREGILKKELKSVVGYLFLEKKNSLDLSAFKRLKNYVIENEIKIIHAHSTSYFLCALLKFNLGTKVKLIWHDHYGESEFLEKRPKRSLRFFSKYFDGVFSVNERLADWTIKNLQVKKVEVFKNFINNDLADKNTSWKLKGKAHDFKLICVANLRPQKDHFTLIKAFDLVKENNVSLHLIGKDFGDEYSKEIFDLIENSEKKDSIFYYGSLENVMPYLQQADTGILASRSEGLPLALLEYGLAGLPVICTDVGECFLTLGDYGSLVPPNNPEKLRIAIESHIQDKGAIRSKKFQEKVKNEFTAKAVLPKILNFYQSI